MNEAITEITGTFRVDFEVGDIVRNAPFTTYGENHIISFKVLRESSEDEWRKKYNYTGPLPPSPTGKEARYFEIVALD